MKITQPKHLVILFYNKFLLIVLFLCFCFKCISQETYTTNAFKLSHLSQDEGLSQSTNMYNFEDSKGFMWITAYDAINRYDGKYCKVYNKDFYFLNCPALQQGYGFAEDSLTNIYVGSTIGLYIYNRNKDRFTLQKIYKNEPDEIAMPFAFKGGKIWCYNRQYHLASFDIVTKKIEYYKDVKIDALSSIHIYEISGTNYAYRQPFFDKYNNIWIVSNNNVAKYNLKKRIVQYPFESFIKSNPSFVFHACMYDEVYERILISYRQGVAVIDVKNDGFNFIKSIPKTSLFTIGVLKKIGNCYCVDAFNRNSFNILDHTLTKTQVCDFENIKHGKLSVPITFAKNDNKKVWMRDDGFGFNILDFSQQPLNKELGKKEDGTEIFTNSIHSFAELPNEDILILSSPNVYVKEKNSIDLKLLVDGKTEGVTRIFTDTLRKGVWFYIKNLLNSNTFLKFYDGQKKVFANTKITISNNDKSTLQDLKLLPNGKILAACSNGLFWVNENTLSIIPVNNNNKPNAFTISYFNNNLYGISYLNNDMSLVEIQKDSIVFKQTILPKINSFYGTYDKQKKQYWIGTNAGLYLLDDHFKTIKKFDANNGFAGNYIYGLLLDDVGNVWTSHQQGISSVNTTNYKIVNYNKEDGIQDWDFNNRCYFKSSKGLLYFGGRSGYNYFKPPISSSNFIKPEVYIDEILVNNKPYIADTNANNLNEINIDYKQGSLFIKAIAKDLNTANDLNIIYRITNKDSNWLKVPNNYTIVLNNLAPGSYTLEIGYSNRFDEYSRAQKIIHINVSTPFYKASWFIILTGAVIASLIFWVFYNRNLLTQKRQFEKQLAVANERTRITNDLHDDIGSTISSINVYSNVATELIEKNPPKAKELLGKLNNQSKNLMEHLSEIIWSLKTDENQLMTIDARIKNYISDVLGAAEINYSVEIDDNINTKISNIQARKNVMLIIKEAINNITKYSNAKNVSIKLKELNQTIMLTISDDGVGFQQKQTKGNGLANIKKRTKELNGNCSIISDENKGVTIECIFNKVA